MPDKLSNTPDQETRERRIVDYTHETDVARNPALRYLWLGLGLLSVGLAFIGAFLPLMPTTIFLILATYFFARSSPRFYNWLMNHRIFGQFIRDWKDGKGIPMRAKITAVSLIIVTITISAILVPSWIARIIVILCGIGVSTYLITRPTKITS